MFQQLLRPPNKDTACSLPRGVSDVLRQLSTAQPAFLSLLEAKLGVLGFVSARSEGMA